MGSGAPGRGRRYPCRGLRAVRAGKPRPRLTRGDETRGSDERSGWPKALPLENRDPSRPERRPDARRGSPWSRGGWEGRGDLHGSRVAPPPTPIHLLCAAGPGPYSDGLHAGFIRSMIRPAYCNGSPPRRVEHAILHYVIPCHATSSLRRRGYYLTRLASR